MTCIGAFLHASVEACGVSRFVALHPIVDRHCYAGSRIESEGW